MKNKILSVILLGVSLSFIGCGNQSDAIVQEAVQGNNEATQEIAMETTMEATTESLTELSTQEVKSSATENIVEITSMHFEGESGTVSYEYDMPIVKISDNIQAQDMIQADLRSYVDKFLLGLSEYDYDNSEIALENYQNLSFNVIRADEQVISIAFSNEGYAGGAHGWCTLAYFNYYTKTGERITFDSLGDGFRIKAEELVASKAKEMQEDEEVFFSNYEDSICLVVLDGTESASQVYQRVYPDWDMSDADYLMDATFYITDTEFGFVSGQYVLQPYAAGIIIFTIDASEFSGVCNMNFTRTEGAIEAQGQIFYKQ